MNLTGALQAWPEFLAQLFVRGSLLLILAGIVTRLLVRAPAAARHLVWTLSLAGLLVLPAVTAFGPRLPLPVFPSRAVVEEVESNSTGRRQAPPTTGGALREASASPAVAPAQQGLSLSALALVGLATLTTALLLYLSLGLTRVWSLCRQAQSINDDPDWLPMLNDLRRRIGVRRTIDLRISDRIAVPSTWGIGRPSILLPREAATWAPERRRDCLLHELAHVRRLDWLSHMTARLACALHWFNPLVWWASRQLHLEAERACDDAVLLEGSSAPEYAEQLLGIARSARREASFVAFVSMAMPARLATRIHFILHEGQRRTTMKKIQVFGTSLAALLLILAAGGFRLVEAAPQPRDRADRDERRATGASTPLMRAAASGNEVEMKRLLASGSDPDGGVRGLGSPLILAAEAGHASAVRVLLEAGADPRHFETGGDRGSLPRSALAAAAQAGHLGIVDDLLAAGAAVDATPRGDATALMYAAENGHGEIVVRLLAAGADPRAEIDGDGTPLIAASRGGGGDIVRTLLEAGADPDRVVDGDESPLYHAVRGGHVEIVKLLLAEGADVNQVLDGDGTALMQAAESGDEDMVDLLLAAGADPDESSPGDGNALIQAARNGNRQAVRRLVDAGADVNAAVHGDGNPIIMAAGAGHLEIVEYLVRQGARVDQVVPGDENALISAAGGGHLDIVRFLVEEAGADMSIEVRERGEIRTALSMARRGGHEEVVDYLLARGATR